MRDAIAFLAVSAPLIFIAWRSKNGSLAGYFLLANWIVVPVTLSCLGHKYFLMQLVLILLIERVNRKNLALKQFLAGRKRLRSQRERCESQSGEPQQSDQE